MRRSWSVCAVGGVLAVAGLSALPTAAVSRPQAKSAAYSTVSFLVTEPALAQVRVSFTGGITNVAEQSAAGDNLSVFTAASSSLGTGFLVQSNNTSSGAPGTVKILVQAVLTPGTPVTGTATVPAGATLSAGIGNDTSHPISNGHFSIANPSSLGSAPGPTISVRPGTTGAGGRVTISGSVAGGCARGDAVALLSRAFVNTYSFAGVPTVYATVGKSGRFSVRTRIPASRKAGNYSVTGRCGGGNLGAVAHLRVIRPVGSRR